MDAQVLFPLLLVLVAAIVITGAILAWRHERRRREALARLAASLGFTFNPDRDHSLARKYQDLRDLHRGENRYVFDLIEGRHREVPFSAFDFHYETTSTDNEGRTRTDHHHLHLVIVHLEREFPNLLIGPEGVFSKIAQALGFDDIDFESHEFSRRFCVRSSDRKFAYDFCNARMIELLLAHPNLSLEVRAGVFALVFTGRMKPDEIQSKLDLAADIREKMPDYLFAA
jgi:hypothetical protein